PDAEEIDRRGVLEALPGLNDRAERADLLAVEHPGVVVAPGRGLAPLHAGRAVAEPRLDTALIHVGRLDDMGIRRDQFPASHRRSSLSCVITPPPRAGAWRPGPRPPPSPPRCRKRNRGSAGQRRARHWRR